MAAKRKIPASKFTGLLLPVLLLLVLILPACSPRQMAVREMSSILETGANRFEQDEDLDLIEAAMPANIKLLESFLAETPDDPQIRSLLARLYGSYAFAFAERDLEAATLLPGRAAAPVRAESQEEQVRRYYRKGAEYALEVIEKRHPGCREQLDDVTEAETCFARIGKEDLPALFWYGFDLGGYVNNSRGSIRALSRAHLAEKAMQRVIALDPSYYHGGAHLFLMIYYAARPPMAGGNPETAMSHYRALKEMFGDALSLPDLFRARYLLYQDQDRDAFHRVLTAIRERPVEPGPHRLLNKVAADRAALYLLAEDRLFP
ncbi:MAG: TRAP transporter TatT component family protein [Desulfobacterales bacterium]|jgi:tetratricopeptide (TPR) repeat protein